MVKKIVIPGIVILLLITGLFIFGDELFSFIGVKSSYEEGDTLNIDITPYTKGMSFIPYECGLSLKLNGEEIFAGIGDICTWGDCYSLRNKVLTQTGTNTLRFQFVCKERCGLDSRYDRKVDCVINPYTDIETITFNVESIDAPTPTPAPTPAPTPTPTPTPTLAPTCTYNTESFCVGNNYVRTTCNARDTTICAGGYTCTDTGCKEPAPPDFKTCFRCDTDNLVTSVTVEVCSNGYTETKPTCEKSIQLTCDDIPFTQRILIEPCYKDLPWYTKWWAWILRLFTT